MDDWGSKYWSGTFGRRVSRRTALRGAGLTGAGLAAAALIGCGDSTPASTPTAAPPTTASEQPSTGPTETGPQVKRGGRLQLSQAGDPPSFDLHRESTTYTNYVTSMAYNQLVRFDPDIGAESPETIIGDLATSWEVSPDGQTYTFHLVDTKYHDGTPFTSADVKASLQRQKDKPADLPAPPRGDQLAPIGVMQTPDDRTLLMTMSRPVSPLSMLPILGQSWMAIYSKSRLDGGFDRKRLANGTGAFIMRQYNQGSKVNLDRNPDYFAEGQPYLDGVDVFIIPDASTTQANFQAGKVHVLGISRRDLPAMQGALGDKLIIEEGQALGFNTINFGGREPWTDVRVRQAVCLAMDKQAAIDVQNQGDGLLGGYMPAGGYWAISEADLETIPGYAKWQGDATIAEARKMLDAAGVPAQLDSLILTRQGASFESFSLYIQDQLAKVGINAKLDIQETASAYDILAKRDFDLAPWNHGIALDDPDAVYAEFYITGGARNYSQISSPEIDEMFLKQSMELDTERRRELVRELQLISMPEQGKVITNWSKGREGWWNYVKGYTRHQNGYNNRQWRTAWLDV